MPASVEKLENKLNEMFVKKAPALPSGAKKFLIDWAPIVAAIIGILTLLSAWTLWKWADQVNGFLNYSTQFCDAYSGACGHIVSRFTVWIWIGVIVLACEGLLYLFSFSGLKAHKKQGWNYLFYGALLNVAYAVVSLFSSYNVVGQFIGSLIGAAIGLYLLFQIREAYIGKTASTKTSAKK